MKIRLVEVYTPKDDKTIWYIETKWLFGWGFLDMFITEYRAREMFDRFKRTKSIEPVRKVLEVAVLGIDENPRQS